MEPLLAQETYVKLNLLSLSPTTTFDGKPVKQQPMDRTITPSFQKQHAQGVQPG